MIAESLSKSFQFISYFINYNGNIHAFPGRAELIVEMDKHVLLMLDNKRKNIGLGDTSAVKDLFFDYSKSSALVVHKTSIPWL